MRQNNICVISTNKSIAKYKRYICRYTTHLFSILKINKSLNILLTGNSYISYLHRYYLGNSSPTDVISFHSYGLRNFLGELVISVEYAKIESKKRGIKLVEELARYVTHGILHLLGYRDDKPKLQQIMWRKQEGLLRKCFKNMGDGQV